MSLILGFLAIAIVLLLGLYFLKLTIRLLIAERFSALSKELSQALTAGRLESNEMIKSVLEDNTRLLNEQMRHLSETNEKRLIDINRQVEKRLSEGFEKTTATFADVVKRLALIDQAQKKISELSGSVVSLKEILTDKRSRGAFGEVQLKSLIQNLLPDCSYAFQYTLSNDKRCDCILFMPDPTGNVVVDAKFPLENYQKLVNPEASDADRKAAEQAFKRDIKTHINDISSKYILPPETADGAVMFIPAEAVFAEIHGHYPDLVEYAYQQKVWLASPTTMMAILTTAKAVLKDDATKRQVHIIQEHLGVLSKDFDRFQKRMDGLERHIGLANDDVKNINISARKITSRFEKIEQVELGEDAQLAKVE